MQRVSAFLPSWDKRTSSGGAKNTASLFGWGSRSVSSPPAAQTSKSLHSAINNNNTARANNASVHRQAFWPATLDQECDKAARIIKSFCVDGYLHPIHTPSPDSDHDDSQPLPSSPVKIIHKIPKRIIQNAAGIAVFTCMRSGLWMTGSGGSGILIARKSDGTWSPPSGIMLHTPTLSFIIGVDVYDCVLVISNLAALETITKSRVTLGLDVGLLNGPSLPLDSQEQRISWKDLDNTVLAYMKARGQHQSVNLNGCILTERANENERFYNAPVSQMDVLSGNVDRNVNETKPLFEVIKMAEGRCDFDPAVIANTDQQPAPGDALIETPSSTAPASPRFGLPKADDPDPFGILALEMAGLEIREAGTRLRPASSQVDFGAIGPPPSSPSRSKFSRLSIESMARSNRASCTSTRTIRSHNTDASTTSNDDAAPPFSSSIPRLSADRGSRSIHVDRQDPIDDDTTADMSSSRRRMTQEHKHTPAITEEPDEPTSVKPQPSPQPSPQQGNDEADAQENDADDDEEPVIYEVAAVQPATSTQAVASHMIQARGNVVTIAKRVPPPLPRKSPARLSRLGKNDGTGDAAAMAQSPLRQAFSEADLLDDGRRHTSTHDVEDDDVKSAGDMKESRLSSASDINQPLHTDVSDLSDGQFLDADVSIMAPPIPLRLSQPSASVDRWQKLESRNFHDNLDHTKMIDNSNSAAVDKELQSTMAAFDPMAQVDEDMDSHPSTPQNDHTDVSDSASIKKKHSSSIYTGATDDRWSYGASSPTTPTSDRQSSVYGDYTDDGTPRKKMGKRRDMETVQHIGPLEPVENRKGNVAPTTVTVV